MIEPEYLEELPIQDGPSSHPVNQEEHILEPDSQEEQTNIPSEPK